MGLVGWLDRRCVSSLVPIHPPTHPPSSPHPHARATPNSCVIAGTGILQLPYALRLSGWCGIAVILFSAFVNEYTGKLLIECLYVDE